MGIRSVVRLFLLGKRGGCVRGRRQRGIRLQRIGFRGNAGGDERAACRTHSRCRGAVALPVRDRRRRGFVRTLADYDQPLLAEGNYTASFTYGDPEAEGAGAACFSGEEAFTIVARKTVTEPVSVSLANSVFTLVFSDWFRKYYSEFTVNIRTDSGFRAGFVGSASSPLPQTVPQFVKAGTGLYMSGSATKTNGVEVAFPETLVGTTAARTWHTVTVDAGQVGQAGIVVSLDDTPVAVEEIPVELNPDA